MDMPVERRAGWRTDRRRVPRGGRRPDDQPGRYPPVLIADRDDGARRPCARYLEHFHFDVTEAVSGDDARARLTAQPPRVILTESPRWLPPGGCDIPIILMAGAMTADEALTPIEGVAVVLIKPFPLATMLDAVRRVLRASKRR
jgi:DNA-binding NtrC family response regulator